MSLDNYITLIVKDYFSSKSEGKTFGIAKYEIPLNSNEIRDYMLVKLVKFFLCIKEIDTNLIKDIFGHFENTKTFDIKTYLYVFLYFSETSSLNLVEKEIKKIIEIYNISYFNEISYLSFVPYEYNNEKVMAILSILENFKEYLTDSNITYNEWEKFLEHTYNTEFETEVKKEYLKDQNFPPEFIELLNSEMKNEQNINILKENLDDYHNPYIRKFFKLNMKKIRKNIAERPKWIIPFDRDINDVEVPYIPMKEIEHIEVPFEEGFKEIESRLMDESTNILLDNILEEHIRENGVPSDEEYIELKRKVMTGFKEDFGELYPSFSISTVYEKILTLKGLDPEKYRNLEIFDDTDHFKVYGPVNPCWDDNNHGCHYLGGCRMFICNRNEYFEEDEEREEDYDKSWFRGYCDHCGKRITNKKYSLRKPVEKGGWKGCFCSFECLEFSGLSKKETVMCNIMKEQIYKFKIMTNY